ncbi:hypothetical protein GYH30_000823 [Glycine max]|uniref:EF-hand domain-containing protein n=1 Tax=Glycine max TaxID=3847 RepID=A0A0R0LGJ0_SOYBN|nr:hypothetical protein GYH30_000823 [Glycine max]
MGKQVGFEDVLRYFDEDGDGKVSPSELKHGLGMMGGELPMKEAEMAIATLDSDGDGLLSLEDFIALMEFDLNGDGVLSFEEFRIMMQ